MTTIVYGSSDDLIQLEGAISEEFPLQEDAEGDLLAFSTGVVLRIVYTDVGVWRIHPLSGASLVTIEPAVEGDEENYSDRATLEADPTWVVHGIGYARAGGTTV